MQSEPKSEKRQVVPRWRSLQNTASVELRSSADSKGKSLLIDQTEIEGLEHAWVHDRSVESAGELVSAAILFGKRKHADAAARYLDESSDSVPSVKRLAQSYLGATSQLEFEDGPDDKSIASRVCVSRIRKSLFKYPKNSLLYSEIARHYAILGESDKSKYNLDIASILSPGNRIILRNYARMSVHLQHPEWGLAKLSKVPQGDYWIDAAYTALADLIQSPKGRRYSPKKLMELDVDPAEITELIAAIGTKELTNGNAKLGRKLLRKSEAGANDNTVAQLQWSAERYNFTFDESLLEVDGSYEARANSASQKEDWDSALYHCRSWADDEPFSERPFVLGSYISAENQWDYELSAKFAFNGLKSNPKSPTLLNNLAFSNAMLGNLREAKQRLEEANFNLISEDDVPVHLATEGLIQFRENNPEDGRDLYSRSINLAVQQKRKSIAELAYLHWMMEEIRLAPTLGAYQFNFMSEYFGSVGKASESAKRVYSIMKERLFLPKLSEVGFTDNELRKLLVGL